jgi:hypothetical protein
MVHASVDPSWSWREAQKRARRVEAALGHRELKRSLALLRGAPSMTVEADVLGRLTRCRSIGPKGSWLSTVPDSATGEVPWHRRWRDADHDYGVVYGHWALQGLHVKAGLRGLDTGCVHHGRDHDGFLTAWVPDLTAPDPFARTETRFWQVRARRRYYPVES